MREYFCVASNKPVLIPTKFIWYFKSMRQIFLGQWKLSICYFKMLNWMETKLICIELENVHSGNIELVRDEYNQSYYRMSILGPKCVTRHKLPKVSKSLQFQPERTFGYLNYQSVTRYHFFKNLPKKHQKKHTLNFINDSWHCNQSWRWLHLEFFPWYWAPH